MSKSIVVNIPIYDRVQLNIWSCQASGREGPWTQGHKFFGGIEVVGE